MQFFCCLSWDLSGSNIISSKSVETVLVFVQSFSGRIKSRDLICIFFLFFQFVLCFCNTVKVIVRQIKLVVVVVGLECTYPFRTCHANYLDVNHLS